MNVSNSTSKDERPCYFIIETRLQKWNNYIEFAKNRTKREEQILQRMAVAAAGEAEEVECKCKMARTWTWKNEERRREGVEGKETTN